MEDFLSHVPERERLVYEQMRQLPRPEKQALWELIRLANREGTAVHPYGSREIGSLLRRGLLLEMPYRGAGISVKVIPQAPYLLRQLRNWTAHK
ncbi:hypothetical protein [Ectobacillus ponti]|uniref:Uncharacterized protein n=1 Tax=Ectobacillus ponti TaxID=2961894 RepID=A0AA41X2R2_9BACI|nr:hypothetical protein [Ectobacillus ponti]MCP8967547.1 hypothetical protein [Ectobacillus ponti]